VACFSSSGFSREPRNPEQHGDELARKTQEIPMRTKLFTSLVLGLGLLGACAGQTGSTSLDQGELALVSVSADDLEALDDSETLTIDLTKKNVVYEIDGDSAPLDLERLTVMTSSAESMPMRDFLDTTALAIGCRTTPSCCWRRPRWAARARP
jgi:hypothetical protein